MEKVIILQVPESAGKLIASNFSLDGAKEGYELTVSPEGMGIWLAVFDAAGDIAASISHRPEMDDMVRMMEEKGDEIFADADSILVEIDNDRAVVEQVFRFAEKSSSLSADFFEK